MVYLSNDYIDNLKKNMTCFKKLITNTKVPIRNGKNNRTDSKKKKNSQMKSISVKKNQKKQSLMFKS